MARTVGVIGGAGFMGRRCASALATVPDVTVKIADIKDANGAVENYTSLDASKADAVAAFAAEVDIVVNFAGPFFKLGTAVAEGCISAGVPYVDVCDDFDATGPLLALDDAARLARIPIVTGAGMSPGLLNALALWAATSFDQVDSVILGWTVGEKGEGGVAPVEHFLHTIDGDVPTWEGGRTALTPAFDPAGASTFDFPEPIGPTEVRDLGHPEVITFPRAVSAQTIRVKGALLPDRSNSMFRTLSHLGLTSGEPAEVNGASITARRFIAEHLTRRHNARAKGSKHDRCGLGAVISGQIAGVESTASVMWAEHITMATATGIPAAAAALMVAEGYVETGAWGPEALEPEKWFARIRTLAPENFKQVVVVDHTGARSQTSLEALSDAHS